MEKLTENKRTRCPDCGGSVEVTREDYPFPDLPHVLVADTVVYRCERCGEMPTFYRLSEIIETIVAALLQKQGLLMGDEVHLLRDALDLEPEEFALAVGLSEQALEAYEAGRQSISAEADRLVRTTVANALGLPVRLEKLREIKASPLELTIA